MSKKSISRLLRQLAENILREMPVDELFPHQERGDLITSLVRQWLTYDGSATLFMDDEQLYFSIGWTPLGKPKVFPEPATPGWLNRLIKDWKINLEELPEIIEQLNRGQSAEVVRSDGLRLRFWTNPKERSSGIEPSIKQPVVPAMQRDYHKLAGDVLDRHFGAGVDAEEREQLTCSIAQQWRKYRGHACLFDGNQQLLARLVELEEGDCHVTTGTIGTEIETLLVSLGFAAKTIARAIAHINRDEEIAFVDRQGVRSFLRHNPQTRQITVRRVP